VRGGGGLGPIASGAHLDSCGRWRALRARAVGSAPPDSGAEHCAPQSLAKRGPKGCTPHTRKVEWGSTGPGVHMPHCKSWAVVNIAGMHIPHRKGWMLMHIPGMHIPHSKGWVLLNVPGMHILRHQDQLAKHSLKHTHPTP